MPDLSEASERARRYWDEHAPRYDREMGFWEKVLFKGAREWACSKTEGDVLEIAIGTGRIWRSIRRERALQGSS